MVQRTTEIKKQKNLTPNLMKLNCLWSQTSSKKASHDVILKFHCELPRKSLRILMWSIKIQWKNNLIKEIILKKGNLNFIFLQSPGYHNAWLQGANRLSQMEPLCMHKQIKWIFHWRCAFCHNFAELPQKER